MNEAEYIKERLDDQIQWYDNKSQWNQQYYKKLRIIEISAAVLIPFLVGYATDSTDILKVVVGLLGIAVAVVSGILSLYQFQENWTGYRTTAEALKHEKFMFLTKSAPYDVDDPFKLLVERTESLISKENTIWAQYVAKREKKDK